MNFIAQLLYKDIHIYTITHLISSMMMQLSVLSLLFSGVLLGLNVAGNVLSCKSAIGLSLHPLCSLPIAPESNLDLQTASYRFVPSTISQHSTSRSHYAYFHHLHHHRPASFPLSRPPCQFLSTLRECSTLQNGVKVTVRLVKCV